MRAVWLSILMTCSAFAVSTVGHSEDLDQLSEFNYVRRGVPEFDDAVLRFLRHEQSKIFAGRPATLGSIPWQASLSVAWLLDKDNVAAHYCGASIISPRWLLTAAHCVRTRPGDFVVRTGLTTLTGNSPRYTVKQVIIHKGYEESATGVQTNDLALLELNNELHFDVQTNAIPLVDPLSEETIISSSILTISGWGEISHDGTRARELRYAEVKYVSYSDCNDPLAFDHQVSDLMICAGNTGADACQGDSGGPLFAGKLNPTLVGVASWGRENCGEPLAYGVYMRISKYRDWIAACMSSSAACNK